MNSNATSRTGPNPKDSGACVLNYEEGEHWKSLKNGEAFQLSYGRAHGSASTHLHVLVGYGAPQTSITKVEERPVAPDKLSLHAMRSS